MGTSNVAAKTRSSAYECADPAAIKATLLEIHRSVSIRLASSLPHLDSFAPIQVQTMCPGIGSTSQNRHGAMYEEANNGLGKCADKHQAICPATRRTDADIAPAAIDFSKWTIFCNPLLLSPAASCQGLVRMSSCDTFWMSPPMAIAQRALHTSEAFWAVPPLELASETKVGSCAGKSLFADSNNRCLGGCHGLNISHQEQQERRSMREMSPPTHRAVAGD